MKKTTGSFNQYYRQLVQRRPQGGVSAITAAKPRQPTRGAALRDVRPNASAVTQPKPSVPTQVTKLTQQVSMADIAPKKRAADLETDILDIDLPNVGDIQACVQYVQEIYEYMREAELQFRLPADFLSTQTDVSEDNRVQLYDWISKVHTSFGLANESFFHACTLLDHFLSKCPIRKARLRLLGIAGLLVAAKYEQSYIPSLRHFVEAMSAVSEEFQVPCKCTRRYSRRGNSYCQDCTRKAIIDMEELILATLDFRLSMPTSIAFLRRYARICELNNRSRYMAFYISELCSLDIRMIKYTPSQIAAGCLAMTRRLKRHEHAWDSRLEHYSGYSSEEVKPICSDVTRVLRSLAVSPSTRYVQRKYAQKDRYYGVSGDVEAVVQKALQRK
eukprot:gnl/Dysnectes_brevis/1105_a1236_1570.p2 GENE.gnl/Dysnectes_brevis/1105_a1236_1570~~gnl/Dysnectes_brevis/1105_a1236_1570.p2  ORF type:complete len:388 (+),score=154.02 gnl/Dysnectes_brevis/1105_a1236_1570:1027-2190(+)